MDTVRDLRQASHHGDGRVGVGDGDLDEPAILHSRQVREVRRDVVAEGREVLPLEGADENHVGVGCREVLFAHVDRVRREYVLSAGRCDCVVVDAASEHDQRSIAPVVERDPLRGQTLHGVDDRLLLRGHLGDELLRPVRDAEDRSEVPQGAVWRLERHIESIRRAAQVRPVDLGSTLFDLLHRGVALRGIEGEALQGLADYEVGGFAQQNLLRGPAHRGANHGECLGGLGDAIREGGVVTRNSGDAIIESESEHHLGGRLP